MENRTTRPAAEGEITYPQPRPYVAGGWEYQQPGHHEDGQYEEDTPEEEDVVLVARSPPPVHINEATGPRTFFFPEATSASHHRHENALASDGIHLPRLRPGPAPVLEWESPHSPERAPLRARDLLHLVDYNFGPPWARRRIDEHTPFAHDVNLRYAQAREYIREQEARCPLIPLPKRSADDAIPNLVQDQHRHGGKASLRPGLAYHGPLVPAGEQDYGGLPAPRPVLQPRLNLDNLAIRPAMQSYRLPPVSERQPGETGELQEVQEQFQQTYTGLLNTPI
ncbi:hypothetical protein HER10_EVM0012688 [Colletotrichum scovillei]|uniref:Uncharacterized protein n=1 Tax=Colletotrichum scovillei TaxID=1209932 RepID=A0A9P7U5D7_9PEZI|nr:uncharacterized protein HER10_EVM0012688 [Colletotrichum scovillei]KAF4775628.1 hypothetical protein HER10_EVM0012688 [Colletotrichum scovillei]KAG7042538.1 hypothetical protein JMJ78_0006049 [Colletotrichum scovillei]KAG7043091.1 hypothetical protein JMJ77_0002803 [Colletotrichum scovillei]KAG7062538.1 hypothetical protein JMJ76_0009387 [Colletotrichum scovillei]